MIGSETTTKRNHIHGVLKLVGAVLLLRWVLGMHRRGGDAGWSHARQFLHARGGTASLGGTPGNLAPQGGSTGETI